jgi:hypothetical protein
MRPPCGSRRCHGDVWAPPPLRDWLDRVHAHGLALALPEKVEMARPTGVGRALSTYEIPIEGRDAWLAAARRLA